MGFIDKYEYVSDDNYNSHELDGRPHYPCAEWNVVKYDRPRPAWEKSNATALARPRQPLNRNDQGFGFEMRELMEHLPNMAPHLRTMTIRPNTIDLTMNRDRIQCTVCEEWFHDDKALSKHREDFGVRCEEHGCCFAKHDIWDHAYRKSHTRCFVLSCKSRYRDRGGWRSADVKEHIRRHHHPNRDY